MCPVATLPPEDTVIKACQPSGQTSVDRAVLVKRMSVGWAAIPVSYVSQILMICILHMNPLSAFALPAFDLCVIEGGVDLRPHIR